MTDAEKALAAFKIGKAVIYEALEKFGGMKETKLLARFFADLSEGIVELGAEGLNGGFELYEEEQEDHDPDSQIRELIDRLRGPTDSYVQRCDDADLADEQIADHLVNIAGMVLYEIKGLAPNTRAALEQMITASKVPEPTAA